MRDGGERRMKIKRRLFTIQAIIIMAVSLCACGSNDNAKFNGSKTGDAQHFDIDFDILNTTYTHELVMEEGESIEISIEKESGSISLLVQMESEDSVYQGDDVDTGEFEVIISEAGTYTLSVTGKKAKGHVVFTKKLRDSDAENEVETKDSDVEEDITSISNVLIVGPWHLDNSTTDNDALNEEFPGAMEFGNGLEIRSDGRISWYVGADGGTGTYSFEGNSVNATFTSDMDGKSYDSKIEIQQSGEEYVLLMNYKDFTFTWKYGEGETGKGNDEG